MEMFAARDVELPTTDQARDIGTIMRRNKSKFINIEGRVYWLRGEPTNTSGMLTKADEDLETMTFTNHGNLR